MISLYTFVRATATCIITITVISITVMQQAPSRWHLWSNLLQPGEAYYTEAWPEDYHY